MIEGCDDCFSAAIRSFNDIDFASKPKEQINRHITKFWCYRNC